MRKVLLKKYETYDYWANIFCTIRLYKLDGTNFHITANVPTRNSIRNISIKKTTYGEALQVFQRMEHFICRDEHTM